MPFLATKRGVWRWLWVGAIVLSSWLIGLAAQAATLFDPEASWRSLETPHFRVNYETRHEAIAQKAGRYAEEAWDLVVPWLQSTPSVRIEITLMDHEDTRNGFAVPYPNAMIYLYLNAADGESLTGRYDSYLKQTITHEFTHAVHFETAGGLSGAINRVFGRAIYPNLFQPFFLVEGLAVTAESLRGPGGRTREGDFDMILRAAALDDKLLEIDQASGWSSLGKWPGGAATYIYGSYFYQYLMHHYGSDAPAKIAREYGQWPWFGINQAIGRALPGKTAYGLWDELKAYLKERAQRQLERIRQHPITASTPVTHTGYYHFHPHWLSDGRLMYTEYGPDQSPILKLDPMDGSPGKRVVGKLFTGAYSISKDRFVYLSSAAEYQRYRTYDDLFRVDLKAKRVDRLTEGRRASDPAISPDGRWIVASVRDGESTQLVVFDSGGAQRQVLTRPRDDTEYSGATWSPDGKTVAVSGYYRGARDLYLFEPGRTQPAALWRDTANELSPCFSADGQWLYFASDRDGGVFNLFAYHLKEHRLFQITNVVGAAIEPAPSPDGKQLAFAAYGSDGWDIHRMPLEPASWREVPVEGATTYDPFSGDAIAAPAPADSPPPALDPPFPSHAYQPWHSLAPKTWSPVAYQDSTHYLVGVTTVATDILIQHYLYANAGWSMGSNRPYYVLSYQNDQLPPSLNLALSDLPALYGASHRLPGGERERVDVWQRQFGGSVSATFPGLPSVLLGNSWIQGQSLSLGYGWLSVENLGMRPSGGQGALSPLSPDVLNTDTKPSAGQINTVVARYKFADNYRSPYAVSPEYGSMLGVDYEKAVPLFGGTASFDRVSADFRRYLGLPWKHHVMALRVAGGMNFGRQDGDYLLGGSGSTALVTMIDERYASGIGSAALRGYAPGALSGDRVAMTSAEYRFPLLELQRGTGTLPFFATRLSGALFADAGWAGHERLNGDMHLGVGAEARLGLSLLFVPTELRLGVAQGTHPRDGGTRFFAEAGVAF